MYHMLAEQGLILLRILQIQGGKDLHQPPLLIDKPLGKQGRKYIPPVIRQDALPHLFHFIQHRALSEGKDRLLPRKPVKKCLYVLLDGSSIKFKRDRRHRFQPLLLGMLQFATQLEAPLPIPLFIV